MEVDMSANPPASLESASSVFSLSETVLRGLLGPAEAQYAEPSLVLALEGESGPLECGATIVDQSADDRSPVAFSVAGRVVWNDLAGETGYRAQLDIDSASFVSEDAQAEFPPGSTFLDFGDDLDSGGESKTFTFRVFAHFGHAPGHGADPIAGDVVSNECSVTLVVPEPQTLTLGLVGADGPIPCGSTVVDQDANDTSPAIGIVGIGYAWNNLSGDTGYREQFDIGSATFVTEDLFLESLPTKTTGSMVRDNPGTITNTIRIMGHVGHAGGHGATPIAGDVVSNECAVTLQVPGGEVP
jgi:hypothetical protein